MTETQAIILAIVAVLSLAVQGLVKALDVLAKRRAAKSDPKPSINRSGIPYDFRSQWEKVYNWTREMHQLHDRRNEDGVPVWYVSSSHAEALKTIAEAMRAQTQILEALQSLVKEIHDKVR